MLLPSTSLPRALALWVLLCAVWPAPVAAQVLALDEEPLDPATWVARVLQDRRTGFGQRSGGQALKKVVDPLADSRTRAYALMGLGTAGMVAERPRLESWALVGGLAERQAAILALGELGATGSGRLGGASAVLLDLLSDPDPSIAECALLALLRTREVGWRELAEGIVAEEGHRLQSVARALIAFVVHPEGSRPSRAAARLLNLRWAAARAFGTIDGKAWAITLVEELKRDEKFLDLLVYRSAAGLPGAAVRDHILQALLASGGAEVVRAAVRAMPPELDRLIEAGLWEPTETEWLALVEEAARQGVGLLMPIALERAARERMIAPSAAGLLVRRDRQYLEVILRALEAPEPLLRLRAARAAADGNLRDEALASLAAMESDPDLAVRAAALVARIRLGDNFAKYMIHVLLSGSEPYGDDQAVDDPDDPAEQDEAEADVDKRVVEPVAGREFYYEELASSYWAIDDLDVFVLLARALEGPERADMLACLHLRGRRSELEVLRENFDGVDPNSPAMMRGLRALGHLPNPDDLEFLGTLFPFEDNAQANAELAVVLAAIGHPKVQPLLQHAVWLAPWNRSVLAAAVVRAVSGIRVLQQWVTRPPSFAGSPDIRRVGFAIGELGGMEALESLSKRIGGGSDRPALQGALLGALVARTH